MREPCRAAQRRRPPRRRVLLCRVMAPTMVAAVAAVVPPAPGHAVALAASAAVAHGTSGTIVTVAGGGVADGSPATQAVLLQPGRFTVSASGTIYICDPAASRVRRVDSHGVMTTLAGSGDPGSSGDGGNAQQAQIGMPAGVALSPDGRIYISDSLNGTIRVVDGSGIISTFASNLAAPMGLAFDQSGTLYVAESAANRVVKITAVNGTEVATLFAGTGVPGYGGDGIPAAAAQLADPEDVAVDRRGNVYIADTANDRIREVDSAAGTIATVLPQSGLASQYVAADTTAVSAPEAVALDAQGHLYVADTGNKRVIEMTGGSALPTYPMKFDASQAITVPVTGVAVGPDGEPYATAGARVYRSVHKYVVAGGPLPVDTVNGEAATNAYLPMSYLFEQPSRNPSGQAVSSTSVAVDPAGNLVIPGHQLVRRVSTAGTISTVAGSGIYPTGLGGGDNNDNGLPALSTAIDPISTAVDAHGNVYFGEWWRHTVVEVDSHGVLHGIVRYPGSDGSVVPPYGDGGPASEAAVDEPAALLVAPDGDLYIADANPYNDVGGSVRRVHDGTITTIAGIPRVTPVSRPLTPGGEACVDGGPAAQTCLGSPTGIALDRAGNLYIADSTDNRVRRIDTGGIISTVAGTGETGYTPDGAPATASNIDMPTGVAVDAAGNVYFVESGSHLVRKIDHGDGKLSTVAGQYEGDNSTVETPHPTSGGDAITSWGEGRGLGWMRAIDTLVNAVDDRAAMTTSHPRGDGGAATSAYLKVPWSVSLDAAGDLFIGDIGDGRVREVFGVADMQHSAAASDTGRPHAAAAGTRSGRPASRPAPLPPAAVEIGLPALAPAPELRRLVAGGPDRTW